MLVDSDLLIEVSRERDQDILAKWEELAGSEHRVLYSTVTAAELWAGARPREHKPLTNLFRALLCVPIDGETGRRPATTSGIIARATVSNWEMRSSWRRPY